MTDNEDKRGCAFLAADGDPDVCVRCKRTRDEHGVELQGELLIQVVGVGTVTGDRAI
jgi:hypothetical protein